MAAMAICVISIISLSNNSYMFARLVFFLWPIILVVVAVRAGFMSEDRIDFWYGEGVRLKSKVEEGHRSKKERC